MGKTMTDFENCICIQQISNSNLLFMSYVPVAPETMKRKKKKFVLIHPILCQGSATTERTLISHPSLFLSSVYSDSFLFIFVSHFFIVDSGLLRHPTNHFSSGCLNKKRAHTSDFLLCFCFDHHNAAKVASLPCARHPRNPFFFFNNKQHYRHHVKKNSLNQKSF